MKPILRLSKVAYFTVVLIGVGIICYTVMTELNEMHGFPAPAVGTVMSESEMRAFQENYAFWKARRPFDFTGPLLGLAIAMVPNAVAVFLNYILKGKARLPGFIFGSIE